MSGLLQKLLANISSGNIRVIDLTFTLSPEFPALVLPVEFGQCAPFRMEEVSRYDSSGPAWYWNNISMSEHCGTHYDAPIHWVTGKDLPNNSVDTIPPENFIAPACVINCAGESAKNPDFVLTVEHILAWENEHGQIPAGSWALMRTDWSKRDFKEYANILDDGAHTPGPSPEAMQFLVNERKILGFGTETIGTDAGQAHHFSPPYPAHHFLHGAGRYGLQCLRNLDELPPIGAVIFGAPLKIRQGSGSPLRILALVEN